MYDQISGIFLIAVIVLVGLGYCIRVLIKGSARFERVDRQGSGVLLGTSLMQMGYWGMQPLGRFFVFCHITPNQLSWASLAFGVLAAVCFGAGRFGLGSIFMAFAALLDGLDGMVARITGTVSTTGGLLDSVIDRYVEFFILGGLLFYYQSRPLVQLVCLLALLGSFMVSYSTSKAENLGVQLPAGGMRRPERMVYLFLGSVLSSISVFYETIDETGRPFAYPMFVSLVVVATLANISAIQRFWIITRSVQQKSGL